MRQSRHSVNIHATRSLICQCWGTIRRGLILATVAMIALADMTVTVAMPGHLDMSGTIATLAAIATVVVLALATA